MLNILHTADWHIGNFPGPERDGKNLRAEDTGMCINQLHDIALLRKPDMILFSGDLFHVARVWADRGLKEVEVAIQAFTALSQICPVVVMRGTPNHDGAEQFEMLKAHFAGDDSVHIITTPTVIQVKSYGINTPWVNVACLPGFDRGVFRAKFPGLSKEEENLVYTEELGKIVMGLRAQCKPGLTSVLMSHYTVPGCNTESGQTQFLAQYEPVLLPEALDAASFDLVALGHIHRPQQVLSCQNTYYSGAINALNFNDELQERGFWIHSFDSPAAPAVKHTFYKTPSREFLTYHFTQTDIDAINIGALDEVADNYWRWNDAVEGKIVRVLYSCTEDAHKAFNRSLLERQLYADGAFWVAEISPEKVETTTAKDELSSKTDPEHNLAMYFDEKGLPDTDVGELVELARPIISTAMASKMVSQYTGPFIPICIEVKNYRNYAEEKFDFSDISFCTINGQNGAGKSSLFMDAILDCLYEEPREGDLTGWIRADEGARSGSICFTFSIGEHLFRVTRTRAKSGKATLNIAEKVDNDWINRSAEKLKDTQQRIENILGMDSLTFRSCALIMQDQYGLFLQASKEDRMTILSNILGLGVYSIMEQLARNRATETNRAIAANKTIMDTLSAEFGDLASLKTKLQEYRATANAVSGTMDTQTLKRENLNLKLSQARQIEEQASKAAKAIEDLSSRKAALSVAQQEQASIIADAKAALADESVISAEASKHEVNEARVQELIAKQAAAEAQMGAAAQIDQDIAAVTGEIEQLRRYLQDLTKHLEMAQSHLAAADACKDAAAEMQRKEQIVKAHEAAEAIYFAKKDELTEAQAAAREKAAAFRAEATARKTRINQLEAKAQMLADSQCVDVTRASCRFLADAKEAQNALDDYRPACTEWRLQAQEDLDAANQKAEALKSEIDALGYDPTVLSQARHDIDKLRHDAQLWSYRQNYVDLVNHDNEALRRTQDDLSGKQRKLEELMVKRNQVMEIKDEYDRVTTALRSAKLAATASAQWVKRQTELPRHRDRLATADSRLRELVLEQDQVMDQLGKAMEEHTKLLIDMADPVSIQAERDAVDKLVQDSKDMLAHWQSKIGATQEHIDRIVEKQDQVDQLQSETSKLSVMAARYDALKSAFSQDGVPHNIIRSMLPLLTSTANTILGQMTGGKMGMEFVTDKILKSNSKKEVPTLDIIINEYGKDSLPYMSKSGGEKVKASLSAILSLAEIKSSQAGIQLGMLFIDEPPFLDAEGIQAYCDALETIQRRYKDLKVMAITHDPTMKARFPQSVDVIKTETGSRVERG